MPNLYFYVHSSIHFLYLSYILPLLANFVKINIYLKFTHPSNALGADFCSVIEKFRPKWFT